MQQAAREAFHQAERERRYQVFPEQERESEAVTRPPQALEKAEFDDQVARGIITPPMIPWLSARGRVHMNASTPYGAY